MDEGLLALAALAEHVVSRGRRDYYVMPGSEVTRNRGMLPKEWTAVFFEADVFKDKLAEKNGKGRDTWVGTFLSSKTNRKVPISFQSGTATVVLRRNMVRGDQKRYYFEITFGPTTDAPGDGPAGGEQATGGTSVGACLSAASSPSPAVQHCPTGVSATSPVPSPASTASDGEAAGNDLDWGP
jgi:hypothetical protein